jgi:hypothetical protein
LIRCLLLPLLPLALLSILLSPRRASAEDSPARRPHDAPVYVLFWFDTEDYLLPADDDAAKRLADLLTERGIRATFKVVGEKARVLERRGRTDVIVALKRHAIGYHANFHSVHPTPAEYEAECGLLDGVAEFARREGRGAADVRRVFGVERLACYGQPGSSWTPQSIVALPQIGVASCYVDSGNHVGQMKGRPFWYCNAIVNYDMRPNETRVDLHDPAKLEPGEKEFTEIANRLRAEGGGVVSIFYHPCEWVHTEFWDGVNFARGRNPPREQWKPPGQRPAEQTERAFRQFEAYVDHIRSVPGVRFITAEDLPKLYADRLRSEGASRGDLTELVKRLTSESSTGIDFQVIGDRAYSPADQFELLTQAAAALATNQELPARVSAKGLLGADGAAPASLSDELRDVPWLAFRDAVLDANDFIQTRGRVPARVYVGPDPVPPTDFLVAMASAYLARGQDGKAPPPAVVRLGKDVQLLTARHVAKDSPRLYGDWVIHRANWRAPKILDVARLQAWTLKPATLAR